MTTRVSAPDAQEAVRVARGLGCPCELHRNETKSLPSQLCFEGLQAASRDLCQVEINKTMRRNWAGQGLSVTGKPLTGDTGALQVSTWK